MQVVTTLFCGNCDEFQEVKVDYLVVEKDKTLKCAYTCRHCHFQTQVEYKPVSK